MAQSLNTTTENTVTVTAFLTNDSGNTGQSEFRCTLDGSDLLACKKEHFCVTTLYYGSHRAGEGDDYTDFDTALDALTTYFNESEDADLDDFPQTDKEVAAILNTGEEFRVKIGAQNNGFPIYLCLSKTTVEEELVDAPVYTDSEGREVMVCLEEVSKIFVVQVKNLNGTFSVCNLDGEVFSGARSWQTVNQVPASVRQEVESVWEVST
jgi:hypothetical protein